MNKTNKGWLGKLLGGLIGENDKANRSEEGDWLVCTNCDRIIGDDTDYSSKCPCNIKNALRGSQRKKLPKLEKAILEKLAAAKEQGKKEAFIVVTRVLREAGLTTLTDEYIEERFKAQK